MNKLMTLLIVCFIFVVANTAMAQTDTFNATFVIPSYYAINVDDATVDFGTLTITPGNGTFDASAPTTTYDLATNDADDTAKITASIAALIPGSGQIVFSGTAATGGTWTGTPMTTTTAVDIQTGIDAQSSSNVGMTLTLSNIAASTGNQTYNQVCTLTFMDE